MTQQSPETAALLWLLESFCVGVDDDKPNTIYDGEGFTHTMPDNVASVVIPLVEKLNSK